MDKKTINEKDTLVRRPYRAPAMQSFSEEDLRKIFPEVFAASTQIFRDQ